MGRHEDEAHAVVGEEVGRAAEQRQFNTLHVDMQNLDFREGESVQGGKRVELRNPIDLVPLGDELDFGRVLSADRRLAVFGRQTVELHVVLADGEMGRVRLDTTSAGERDIVQVPHRVIRPEGAEFEDDAAWAAIPKDFRETPFFLRLMVTTEAVDDVGHPIAVVTAVTNEKSVVHDLHAAGRNRLDTSGVRDLR